jgi:hypothetical protein
MLVVDLYDGIYKVLANDKVILDFLGIGVKADNLVKSKHIQKRSNPQDIVKSLPVICFYAPPGHRSTSNHLVYAAPFIFDAVTADNVPLAQSIVSRITQLFDGEINPFSGIENFEARMLTAHESKPDLANTYCFTVVIEMVVSLEK